MNEFDKMSAKRNEAKERKKKALITGIVICIILIIVLAFMIIFYRNQDAHTFKVFINDQQMQYNQGFYYTDEKGDTYVRAKDIANYIGWAYQNGEFGSFTEELTSGCVLNEYEAASFVVGSNTLKKYINVTAQPYTNELGEEVNPYETNSVNGTLETSTLALPIVSNEAGEIYFPLKCLPDICGCSVNYDNPYRMYIYTQESLITLAQTNAAQFGYKNISGIYENMRLLAYGKMVVSNGSLYGVVNLYDGQNVIGLKYTDMIFAQNVKEFFVKTNTNDEESIGIINLEGNQVVAPKNYSNINVLSDELGLYLVEKDEEYGVLNREGEVIVHCEYDSIGLPEELLETFEFSADDNKYMLFDNTIIVEDDDRYGVYNIEGEQIFKASFLGLGYLVSNDKDSVKNSEDVLTIEIENLELSDGTTRNVKAVVMQQEVDGDIKYGVYDAESEKLILPCTYDRIYSITSKGQTEYYIELQNQRFKFTDLLVENPYIFDSVTP